MAAAVQLKVLEKRFRSRVALDRVDLEIREGEVFGLVGPNGAGKSTLLRILVGVVRPTAGDARVFGLALPAQALAVRRRTGYLPGDASLYERMRGEEFLRFALSGYPRIDRDLERRLVEAFELPLRLRIRAYSHGMKRKLALVAALAPETPLHLLDEPTEGLDPSARRLLLDLLRELRARGRTVVFSDHGLAEVERICDRIAFLDRGRLLDCDSTDAIRRKAARRLRVSFRVPMTAERLASAGLPGAEEREGFHFLAVDGDVAEALRSLSSLPVASLEWNRLALEEIYADLYGVRPCSPAN